MKLNFRNELQVTLWEVELSGQISDGMWENTRPWDHWKVWCDAKVGVDPNNLGRSYGWVRKDNYNLNSKELLDVVGKRMVYAMNLRFAGLSNEEINQIYDADKWWFELAKKGDKYWVERTNRIIAKFGSFEAFEIEREKPYTRKDLNRELQDMKKIMKIRMNDAD